MLYARALCIDYERSELNKANYENRLSIAILHHKL